ncbi:MarR family transcriptional regulator [Streptomyces sp. NPDC047072]|uniref:MarR family winged helix-turn-helix transcriptional regulator n=1 Tax=Streptomyces sp. NPDC047072 TaxID=3154809 RepID=UPI00340BE796
MAAESLPVLASTPGHLIRRTQQLHAVLWQQHVPQNLTSMQYGVLLVLGQQPGIDQRTVAELMSLDKTTAAGVLRRLEGRGLVVRDRDPGDGRRMLARLTEPGEAILVRAAPAVLDVQDRLLQPLSFDEGEALLRLLRLVVYRGEPPSTTASIPQNAAVSGWPLRLPALRLHTTPGHLIRRAQQLHTTLWSERVSAELTSVQYSVLLVLQSESPIDQRMLGRHASLDKSSGGDVIARLESRELIARTRDAIDGRRNLLTLSAAGREQLYQHARAVFDVQSELVRPLLDAQRGEFVHLMKQLIADAAL